MRFFWNNSACFTAVHLPTDELLQLGAEIELEGMAGRPNKFVVWVAVFASLAAYLAGYIYGYAVGFAGAVVELEQPLSCLVGGRNWLF